MGCPNEINIIYDTSIITKQVQIESINGMQLLLFVNDQVWSSVQKEQRHRAIPPKNKKTRGLN